jgi:hypothetical protein
MAVPMSLEHLLALGANLESLTYRRTEDRDQAQRLLEEWASRDRHPDNASFIQWLRGSPGHVHRSLWAARWAHVGFPQVVVGHKLAASLMATRVPPEAVSGEDPAPWPAYAIVLPNDFLPVVDRTAGGEAFASYVLVERWPTWFLIILGVAESSFFIVRTATTLAKMLDEDIEVDELGELGDYRAEARDARILSAVARLVIGVELELRDRTNVREPRPGRAKNRARESPEPAARTYVLTRGVLVDCRDEVVSHLRGERRNAPRVQVLVRGHWRYQAHGPGLSQRKWLQIEPHWRGPEDAPIAVRRHAMGEPGKGSGS